MSTALSFRTIAMVVFNQQEASTPAPRPPTPMDIRPAVDVPAPKLNRRVKPRMQISEAALHGVEAMAPTNPAVAMELGARFPRTPAGELAGMQLRDRFPDNGGDRAQARAQKKSFRGYT